MHGGCWQINQQILFQLWRDRSRLLILNEATVIKEFFVLCSFRVWILKLNRAFLNTGLVRLLQLPSSKNIVSWRALSKSTILCLFYCANLLKIKSVLTRISLNFVIPGSLRLYCCIVRLTSASCAPNPIYIYSDRPMRALIDWLLPLIVRYETSSLRKNFLMLFKYQIFVLWVMNPLFNRICHSRKFFIWERWGIFLPWIFKSSKDVETLNLPLQATSATTRILSQITKVDIISSLIACCCWAVRMNSYRGGQMSPIHLLNFITIIGRWNLIIDSILLVASMLDVCIVITLRSCHLTIIGSSRNFCHIRKHLSVSLRSASKFWAH